jgi:replication initiation and membrane attachment protein DnaB
MSNSNFAFKRWICRLLENVLAIEQETKNKIIALFFKKRLPIREIAKITKKSSRDIIACKINCTTIEKVLSRSKEGIFDRL